MTIPYILIMEPRRLRIAIVSDTRLGPYRTPKIYHLVYFFSIGFYHICFCIVSVRIKAGIRENKEKML